MAAEPASVRLARTEIMRWFHEQQRTDDNLAASVALAVSEAVGNVVRHAYPGASVGRVEIEARFEGSKITVIVSDGGTGMMARVARDHHGMGLPVIGRVADGVTVDSDEAGTKLSMRFDLSTAPRRSAVFAARQERAVSASAH